MAVPLLLYFLSLDTRKNRIRDCLRQRAVRGKMILLHKIICNLRKCRNWQTSKTKDLVLIASVRVQVPPSARLKRATKYLVAFLFFKKCKFASNHTWLLFLIAPMSSLNPGFKVSSAQSACVGRFSGEMVHRTISYFRFTPPSADFSHCINKLKSYLDF